MERRQITLNGQPMTAVYSKYTMTGQTAIQVLDQDGPYIILTTAVEGIELSADEVIIPTHNVPQNLIDELTAQGFWAPTSKRVELPFHDVPVYRLTQPPQ